MILGTGMTLLSHELKPGRVTWVSVGNYLPCDVPAFAAAVGVPYEASLDYGPGGGSFQSDCVTAAKVIDLFFHRLMTNYLADGGGHWRSTAAQLAHQTWRRSFYTEPVLEHDDTALYRLERDGIYGGRAEAYFVGTVGNPPGGKGGETAGPNAISSAIIDGPLYQFDVRSQYPALLATMPFPVAFDRFVNGLTPSGLRSLLTLSCAIANVEIETNEPDYPYRTTGGITKLNETYADPRKPAFNPVATHTIFPVGIFWTTLYGPELIHALERGRVLRVGAVARYRAGYPFKAYAESLLNLRAESRRQNDPCRESLLKLLANAFAGKFAAHAGGWKTVRGKLAPDRWGEWHETNSDGREPEAWRSLSGVSQKYERKNDTPKGVPSVFGYLTSYGRLQLLEIMKSCGRQGVVWCHTDGIVTTPAGREKLLARPELLGDEPGQLRFQTQIDRARIWGPSHYFADGEWTLSGFTSGNWLESDGLICDWIPPGVSNLITARGDTVQPIRVRRSQLRTDRFQHRVCPQGWRLADEVRNGVEVSSWVDDSLPL